MKAIILFFPILFLFGCDSEIKNVPELNNKDYMFITITAIKQEKDRTTFDYLEGNVNSPRIALFCYDDYILEQLLNHMRTKQKALIQVNGHGTILKVIDINADNTVPLEQIINFRKE